MDNFEKHIKYVKDNMIDTTLKYRNMIEYLKVSAEQYIYRLEKIRFKIIKTAKNAHKLAQEIKQNYLNGVLDGPSGANGFFYDLKIWISHYLLLF